MNFVVQEAADGRSDRIKAYSIGVDVFGRGEDFDPNVDPIVRIEATRLRSALAAYYRGAGKDDPVKILMRPGTYIPEFTGLSNEACGTAFSLAHSSTAAFIASHATDPRNKCAFACGSILMKMLARRLIEERHRVFFASMGAHKNEASGKDVSKAGNGAFGLEVSVLPFAGGKRYVWTISDQGTGELCGIDDIDQMGDGLPDTASMSELTSKAFCSITAMVGRTARH